MFRVDEDTSETLCGTKTWKCNGKTELCGRGHSPIYHIVSRKCFIGEAHRGHDDPATHVDRCRRCNLPNPNVGTYRLTDFDARSRKIIKALGLSQCRIPKGVRVWVHTYRALSMSPHQCRLHPRELPTVQSVVTFTTETIGKSMRDQIGISAFF